MTRKRTRRQVVTPMPPRGLRPKFSRPVLTNIALAHMETLDEIAKGGASEATLWHLAEAAFTWQRVAQVLGLGEQEMLQQLLLATQVVERYRDRGVIAFTGVEYQVAKLGVQVMDTLAEQVDEPTAQAAAAWSNAKLDDLVDRARLDSRRRA
jgi:hypothetical protein